MWRRAVDEDAQLLSEALYARGATFDEWVEAGAQAGMDLAPVASGLIQRQLQEVTGAGTPSWDQIAEVGERWGVDTEPLAIQMGVREPLTARDVARSLEESPGQLVPYWAGVEDVSEQGMLFAAAQAMEAGTATPEQERALLAFLAQQDRPQTMGYRVASILAGMPSYVGEFLTSGGSGDAGPEDARPGRP